MEPSRKRLQTARNGRNKSRRQPQRDPTINTQIPQVSRLIPKPCLPRQLRIENSRIEQPARQTLIHSPLVEMGGEVRRDLDEEFESVFRCHAHVVSASQILARLRPVPEGHLRELAVDLVGGLAAEFVKSGENHADP